MTIQNPLDFCAGQRIIAGFDGTTLNSDLKFLMEKLRIGGVILFSRNITSPEQMKELCFSIQDFAKSCNLPELFIAIDQEGGVVSRLKEPFTQFPGGAPSFKTFETAKNFAEITAKELTDTGVNMNMAPVLDIEPPDFNGIMKKRVLGNTPEKVSELGLKIIKHLQQNNVLAVAKHFPGIGRTILDSHFELPVLNDDIKSLESFDLIPFEESIKNDVSGIMLSHILYNRIDEKWPASLSVKIAKNLLREKMGYKGVVMTDDLDMKAIKLDIKTSVKRIGMAEIDIGLICHKGPDIETAFEEFKKNMSDDPDLKQKGDESIKRIFLLKEKLKRN